jgi:hypothetical protein
MRRLLLPALAGALLLGGITVFSLPARLLPYLIDPEVLRVSALSGTLLNGRAARAMLQTPAGYLHLGALDWRLLPSSLLRFSPALELRGEWGGQRGRLIAQQRDGLIRLRDVDVQLAAGLLRQLVPIELEGRIGVQLDELLLSPEHIALAEGRVVWQGGAWNSPTGRHALGSYAATLSSPEDGRVDAVITTLSGPVSTEGRLSIVKQRYDVDLLIDGTGVAGDPELAQALSLIASPAENGYRLRLDGAITPGP